MRTDAPICSQCGARCMHDWLYTGGRGWRSWWVCPNHRETDDSVEQICDTIRRAIGVRLHFIEAQRRQERVQYVLDFAFVRAQLEGGGFAVSSVKCPSCGGPLELPAAGSQTTCAFCNSSILATDLVERLKDLIGAFDGTQPPVARKVPKSTR